MKKFFLVLLAGAALQAAFAQDDDADYGPIVEAETALDFVVTASRTPESANKVAGLVTVITAEDIAESGAATITEVLETVPGVRVTRDATGASMDVSMRGISANSGRGKVLVIVDGMRLNPIETRTYVNWDMINLSDVERIEVLDGGASVQYGDNAQAGVINIITKKSGAAKTDITVSAGSFFQNEQRFSHHQPTGWGGFTVSGGHHGTQGYQKHTASDAGNGELRGIFDINDKMNLQANVGFSVKNILLTGGLTKDQFDDDPTQNGGASGEDYSTAAINAGIGFAWTLNDTLSLDVPASYNYTDVKYYSPVYGVRTMKPQMLGFRPKVSAEFKPAGMGLRLTGGVDTLFAFSDLTISSDLVKETNPTVQTASEFTLGPWVLVNFEPLPFLSVNAGLRYDAAFLNGHMDEWSGTNQGQDVSYTDGDETTDWSAFVYEAGVTVNPLDFLKVYAKYGTQFKYPYPDEILTTPVLPGGTISLNTGLEPEKGWTVEGGIGLNIKDIAKLDANFYYLKIDNEIFLDIVSFSSVNLDPINRLGANIGLELTPVEYASMDINYSFVNAEFSEGIYEGKVVPLVAKHTLQASLMLHAPFLGLSLGPDVLYKSEMYAGYDYTNEQSDIASRLIWGLKARYAPKKFDGSLAVLLTVHNLADTKYASLAVYVPYNQVPTYYVDPNMGRSVQVSVQYRF
ncbi:MAG: TonB-dependent receptor [Spirochaetaceae bacterium]|nr:TonB-dependent receptor [Spirochaetaceae bacterium]